jgi:hypothetical protein
MPRGTFVRALVLSALVLGIGSAAAADLDDFARCLTRAGATYYTASWCPHCAAQARIFGTAMRWIRSVDCTTGGCGAVRSFPTWTFRNGSRLSGVLSLAELARRTGCPLVAEDGGLDRERTRAWNALPTREHTVGGLRVVEVPGR